ncbi:MAG TPA: amidohydrolase family protein [Acidimicrobiales bacterium]
MGRVFLTGAVVVDALGPPRPGSTVVIDGERIADVRGPGADPLADVRADDRVVDLGGRTVMPGMVTCHFHATYDELGTKPAPFGLEEPPAYQAIVAARNLERALRCGFTGVVSAGAPHDIDASMKRAIENGLFAGPRMLAGSRDLSSTGHANDNAPWYWDVGSWGALRICDGPDEFRKAARDEIKRGAEIIKMFVTGGHGTTAPKQRIEVTREELQAVVDTAHSRGAKVRGHIVSKPAILMALDAGIDVIDHGDELDTECIDRMVELGTFLTPSCFFPAAFLESMGGRGLGFTDTMAAELDAVYKVLPEANAAGVKLVLGDDYGAMGFPHGRYAEELELYVREAGIPARDVIRWATLHGAELLGLADQTGMVEAGKLADLLVVDGDPLDDIRVLSRPDGLLAVFKGGVAVRDDLARLVTVG